MRNLYLFIQFAFVSCFCNQNVSNQTSIGERQLYDSITYSNNTFKMTVYSRVNTINEFKLFGIKNQEGLIGIPELILVDGQIPEGSLRQDHNFPSDYRGYECDATYQYISKNVKIAFALEKVTKQRLDLVIYDSKLSYLKDGDYTLVRSNEK